MEKNADNNDKKSDKNVDKKYETVTVPDKRNEVATMVEKVEEKEAASASQLQSHPPSSSKEPDKLRGVASSRAESPHSDTTNHHNPGRSRDLVVTGQNGPFRGLYPHLTFNLFTRADQPTGLVELEESARLLGTETLDQHHHQ